MKLYKKISISAAHKLNLPYNSKCNDFHGHNYLVEVWVTGDLDQNGMLIDFSIIKETVKQLDHKCLNDFIEVPTCENIVIYLSNEIEKVISLNITGIKIRVWETENGYVEKTKEINR